MAALAIPRNPGDITSEWLTQALLSSGILTKAKVTSLELEPVGKGSSFIGQIVRIKPEYDKDECAPKSFIAKLPASDPTNRYAMNQSRAYEIEVRFYEQLAPLMPVPTPHRYYSDSNQDTADHILLLEDIASTRVGDDVLGVSDGDYDLALTNLAKIHVFWWDHPMLVELDWIRNPAKEAETAQQNLKNRWDSCLQNLGDLIPPVFIEVGEILKGRFAEIRTSLSNSPRTLVHGDFRLDNLLFGMSADSEQLTVIDWQQLELSRGTFDLAYFLVASMSIEKRRAMEMNCLGKYHSVLMENGIEGYDLDRCVKDYKLSLIRHIVMIVNAGTFFDFSDERANAYISGVLQKVGAALEDHRIAELIK